jgi:hypothetical protein
MAYALEGDAASAQRELASAQTAAPKKMARFFMNTPAAGS